jgi:hypothetical protein
MQKPVTYGSIESALIYRITILVCLALDQKKLQIK